MPLPPKVGARNWQSDCDDALTIVQAQIKTLEQMHRNSNNPGAKDALARHIAESATLLAILYRLKYDYREGTGD